MTRYNDADPGFDPRIASWLEGDPRDAPSQVLGLVLATVPLVPQRRVMALPLGFPRVHRGAIVAAAVVTATVVVMAVTAGGLLTQPRLSGDPSGPAAGSTSPSTSPAAQSPEPSAGSAALATWTAAGNLNEIRLANWRRSFPMAMFLLRAAIRNSTAMDSRSQPRSYSTRAPADGPSRAACMRPGRITRQSC